MRYLVCLSLVFCSFISAFGQDRIETLVMMADSCARKESNMSNDVFVIQEDTVCMINYTTDFSIQCINDDIPKFKSSLMEYLEMLEPYPEQKHLFDYMIAHRLPLKVIYKNKNGKKETSFLVFPNELSKFGCKSMK